MKTKLQAACIILCATIMACSKSESVSLPQDTGKSSQNDPNSGRISADITVLSAEDAVKVSALYSQYSGATKSGSQKTVKSVVPVMTKDGEPAFYAVNYDDGYMLVSATKNYYPVIADVEHGNYEPDGFGTGQDVLIAEYLEAIDASYKYPEFEQYRTLWRRYETLTIETPVMTRVNDDYYDVYDKYCYEWARDMRNVYFLRRQPENMPDDMYQRFCQTAESDMAEVSGYPYMECAVITEKYTSYSQSVEELLKTTWNQGSPYNLGLANPENLGCVTIAVGQIMRYHEYPVNINWSAMPNDTSNTILSTFLAQLHDDIGVVNGGATIDQAKSALEKNWYSATINTHNISDVKNNLKNQRPVYMQGHDSARNVGHAWVCDGFRTSQQNLEYRLYLLTFRGGIPYGFEEFRYETIYGNIFDYYHMNWGWGGKYDGYFYEDNIKVTRTDGSYNFQNNRKDMIVHPN